VPELPEVETTRRGLLPAMRGRRIVRAEVRERRLRWPIAKGLEGKLAGRTVRDLRRRAKYLVVDLDRGALIVHLGMSGRLAVLDRPVPPGPHDHFDLVLDDGRVVRFNDPRRFGSILHTEVDPFAHPLLAACGPEPLAEAFDGRYLFTITRGRRAAIKDVLMNARLIAGVGNIYASEALFRAGIHPRRAAGRVSAERCEALAQAMRATLEAAIEAGGSTLRDWLHADGATGYFQQNTFAYDRAGEPCRRCASAIRMIRQGARATYYCPRCQR